MKGVIYLVIAIVLIAGGYYAFVQKPGAEEGPSQSETTSQQNQKVAADYQQIEGATVVPAGEYAVISTQSEFRWSAKKPLIEGYVNSGTIGLKEGTITVGENSATGSFTIDMNTLDVGLTAKKPGQEGALEGHLKGERWFDVAQYPTATFTIKEVLANSESDITHMYQVRGDLTMKGKTNEISFPATIYLKDGMLIAEAQTEIDRTKWGVTSGSGNFFQDLGDNVIDDMVAISFTIKGQKK